MNLKHIFFIPQGAASFAAVTILISVMVIAPAVSEAARASSPHWRKGSCDTCHQAAQPVTGQAALKASPAQAVCNDCHGKKGFSVCRHRSDITLQTGGAVEVGESLQPGLDDGKVVCTTCHDMAPHCALDIKQRYSNKSFLREGPFDSRSQQCFGCHSKSGYKQRSPHRQVSKGKIKEGTCIFCHGSVPKQDGSGKWLPVEFAVEGRLSQLCNGCHAVGPHPSSSVLGKSGWMHMVAPRSEFMERMQTKVASAGGSMPLDPNSGEITCATCHNPHDRKLEGYPRSGEKTKNKLRFADMCEVCHEK